MTFAADDADAIHAGIKRLADERDRIAKGRACETCQGAGWITKTIIYSGSVTTVCDECKNPCELPQP